MTAPAGPRQAGRTRALLAAALLSPVLPGFAAARAEDSQGLSAGLASGVPAIADTLLPRVGLDPAAPGGFDRLRDWLVSGGQAAPRAGRGDPWRVEGSLTLEEQWTDNPGQAFGRGGLGASARGDDLITLIRPSVRVASETERLTASLRYDPQGQIFARNDSFSQFQQSADGTALATLLPGLAFLDLRGSIAQQSVFGGVAANTVTPLAPNNRQTTSSAAATPYLQRDLGDAGTAQIGGAYSYSAVDAPDALNGGADALGFLNTYGSSWLASTREFATWTTGPGFGRLRNRIGLDASQYDGSLALRDAYRTVISDQASYAVNRLVAVLGEFGYEDLDYPRSGYAYAGGLWSAGLRLTPSAESTISLQYRYADGIGAPLVAGNWRIGRTIRLTGNYSEGISTYGQDLQADLLAGGTDGYGGRTSGLTAAPLLSAGGGNGGNQLLRRSRRYGVSLVWAGDRDTVTLGYNEDRAATIGNPLGLPPEVLRRIGLQGVPAGLLAQALLSLSDAQLATLGLSRSQVLASTRLTTGTGRTRSASVNWQHQFTETTSLVLGVTYTATVNAFATGNIGDTAAVFVDLRRGFGPRLTGHISYGGSFRLDGNQAAAGGLGYADTNAVTLGVTRTF